MNYSKKPTKLFLKKLSKYSKTNQQLYKEIIESLNIISEDPFQKQKKLLKYQKSIITYTSNNIKTIK